MKKRRNLCILLLVTLLAILFYINYFLKENSSIYINNLGINRIDSDEIPKNEVSFTTQSPTNEELTLDKLPLDQNESSTVKPSTTKEEVPKSIDFSMYDDYTESILESIQDEIKNAEKYCDEMKSLGNNQYSITALAWYFKTFQNNGYMDVKHKEQWETKFNDISYPGEDGIFIFKGEKTTPEELGNILYGMVGRMMGFSPKLIYQGSGFAAGAMGEMLNDSENYYGDSKEDYLSVKRGVEYIENEVIIEFNLSLIPPKILKMLKKLS